MTRHDGGIPHAQTRGSRSSRRAATSVWPSRGVRFNAFCPDRHLAPDAFTDLVRRANVDAVVRRAPTGHVTEEMQRHYSTVGLDEKRAAIAGVLQLVPPEPRPGGGSRGGSEFTPTQEAAEAMRVTGFSTRNGLGDGRGSLPPRCVSCGL